MAAIARRLRCELLEVRRLMAGDIDRSMQLSVEATQLDGLRSAEVRLQIDHSLDLSPADIRPGKVWDGKASIVSRIDQPTGVVNIFLFSAGPIDTKSGSLVDIELEVSDELVQDITAASLTEVRLNEGSINPEVVMKFDGLPVVAQAGRSCKPWPQPTPAAPIPQPISQAMSQPTGVPLIKSNFAWETRV